MKNKIIKCNGFQIANNKPLTLIAGPCQLESESHALKMVEKIFRISKKLKINFVYKTSFDKANRTSINGKRGLGLKNSLKIFEKIATIIVTVYLRKKFKMHHSHTTYYGGRPKLLKAWLALIVR